MDRKHTPRGKIWKLLFVKIPVVLIVLSVLWALLLKWCPVFITPLMIQRSVEYFGDKSYQARKKWVPYAKITPEMARAVISSEDNRFDAHKGFDRIAWKEAREEYESGHRKYLRGASTISQQTAKNVFLFPSRSYFRKAIEAYFTVLIEKLWGKKRIMEVYLNVIETGKGLYGVHAAAVHYFNTTPDKLSRRQCCLITACLPNPCNRNAGKPSRYVRYRAEQIEKLESKLLYPDWVYHKKPKDKHPAGQESKQTRGSSKK